jgi:hypothetical protein
MEDGGHDGKRGLHKARYEYHVMSLFFLHHPRTVWLSTGISNDAKIVVSIKEPLFQRRKRAGQVIVIISQEETRQRTMDQTKHGPAMGGAVHNGQWLTFCKKGECSSIPLVGLFSLLQWQWTIDDVCVSACVCVRVCGHGMFIQALR